MGEVKGDARKQRGDAVGNRIKKIDEDILAKQNFNVIHEKEIVYLDPAEVKDRPLTEIMSPALFALIVDIDRLLWSRSS